MNKLIVSLAIIYSFYGLCSDIPEREIPGQLKEAQRNYSTKKIFHMIKHAKFDQKDCNISIEMGPTSFIVTKGEHSFGFSNKLFFGKMRKVTSYQCLLSSDQRTLECDQRLSKSNNSIANWRSVYVHMRINLDESGNAISMEGKKTKEYRVKGFAFPGSKDVITKFKCDIKHPALVKDPTVSNGIGRTENSSNTTTSEEPEKPGTIQK